jgi:hypothetical protein
MAEKMHSSSLIGIQSLQLAVLFVVLNGGGDSLCDEGQVARSCANESVERLSPDAARIVVSHLTVVVRMLKDGGPPVRTPQERRDSWSVNNELTNYRHLGVKYSETDYLNDYRKQFLASWCSFFRRIVKMDSKGAPINGGGLPYDTGGSQMSIGERNGHWDAIFIGFDLQKRAISESQVVPTDDLKGGPARPLAAQEAVLYIAKNVVGGLSPDEGGRPTVTIRKGSIEEERAEK